ncbi:hypothetical protein [Tautonia rosea]|uniref:hypothetical protein n=1 Tax=Tautonia rosea TaxID=2728037 RepID=UPI0014760AD6|nr:hypothetical protein [Tautonia rosea]
MATHEPQNVRGNEPFSDSSPVPSSGGLTNTPPTASDSPKRGRLWALILLAGLLSGVIGWTVGEATLDLFHISEEAAGQSFDFTQANLERRSSGARNAAIAFGVLGATLGLTLGLAGGLARGKAGSGVVGGGLGLLFGGAAGAAIPFLVVPMYFDLFEPAEPTLLLPMMIYGAIWLPIGLAAGLAIGIGLGVGRSIWALMLGGLIGAIVGVATIEVINAIVFPLTHSDQFIPSVGPFSGETMDWERFYLIRGPMMNAHEAGEQAIDQFQLGTATAAARQRLISRFTMPLAIALGIAFASFKVQSTPRSSRPRE